MSGIFNAEFYLTGNKLKVISRSSQRRLAHTMVLEKGPGRDINPAQLDKQHFTCVEKDEKIFRKRFQPNTTNTHM